MARILHAALCFAQHISPDLLSDVLHDLYTWWRKHIQKSDTAFVIWPRPLLDPYDHSMSPAVKFPAPTDLNINMMPIYIGSNCYNHLPDMCKQYADLINWHCLSPSWIANEFGGLDYVMCYLTIQEGWVPVGASQRRPGLHIERPNGIKCNGKWHPVGSSMFETMAWGKGAWHENGLPSEGIFMASTVANSCAIWPALIDNPEEVADRSGGVEHLRDMLGTPRLLQANEMCWFTDRTPHESLPLQATAPGQTHVYRQFFRLVVGPISVWYSKHNTPNPQGIQPDCPISDDDKFID